MHSAYHIPSYLYSRMVSFTSSCASSAFETVSTTVSPIPNLPIWVVGSIVFASERKYALCFVVIIFHFAIVQATNLLTSRREALKVPFYVRDSPYNGLVDSSPRYLTEVWEVLQGSTDLVNTLVYVYYAIPFLNLLSSILAGRGFGLYFTSTAETHNTPHPPSATVPLPPRGKVPDGVRYVPFPYKTYNITPSRKEG